MIGSRKMAAATAFAAALFAISCFSAVPAPTADKFVKVYPGQYTAREEPLVRQYLADNAALKMRGPIDVTALVSGRLPAGTPGLGPVIKVTADWVRYNNLKYDPDSRLRTDAAYARSLGFSDVPAYPTFGAHDDTFMVPWPGAARDTLLVTELNHNVTNYKPIYAGDTLYLVMDEREVIDLTPPEGSIYRSVALNSRGSVYNQRGEKVNDVIFRVTESLKQYRNPTDAPKNPSFFDMWEAPDWLARPAHTYTEKDWDYIRGIWAAERRRGADALYWQDVKVGERPAATLDGPVEVSVSPIPPWGMGAGGSRTLRREILDPALRATLVRGEKDGILRTRDRKDQVPQTPELPSTPGAPPPPNGQIQTTDIHKEGVERSPLVNYVGRDLAIRHLQNWMGDRAELRNIRWSIMDPRGAAKWGKPAPANPRAEHFLDRVPSMKGRFVDTHGLTQDVALVRSEVVSKYVRDGEFLVDLVWWIEALDGSVWEEGAATVKLPPRDSGVAK